MSNKNIRNLVITASAGKAALFAGSVGAQECFDVPSSAVSGDSSLFATQSSGGKDSESTTANTLYTRAVAVDSVLSLTLSGLDTDATDVYIAYSPTKVEESALGTACSGEFLLDTGSLQILEGYKLNRARNMGLPATPLGTLSSGETAGTTQLDLVLNLDDMLEDPSLATNEIYLQAVAFPPDSADISLASVSSVLQISLDRDNLPSSSSDDSGNGDSGSDSGSKSS